PWTGSSECPTAKTYRDGLPARFEKEATTLASLTGWEIGSVRDKMKLPASANPASSPGGKKWWDGMWK
ncbi:MAG: DUF2330 domain-containing protein, partial [Deltaproteobacteria bacterium]|nr:DUF2330 domain-containing protein [Deltaproteobacteria bacterium]